MTSQSCYANTNSFSKMLKKRREKKIATKWSEVKNVIPGEGRALTFKMNIIQYKFSMFFIICSNFINL